MFDVYYDWQESVLRAIKYLDEIMKGKVRDSALRLLAFAMLHQTTRTGLL